MLGFKRFGSTLVQNQNIKYGNSPKSKVRELKCFSNKRIQDEYVLHVPTKLEDNRTINAICGVDIFKILNAPPPEPIMGSRG